MTSNNLTRERIEKVKKNVCISLDSLADENGEVAKSHKDDLNTILTLANAELERQSVTDEDVVEAIQYCVEQEQFNLETLKVETLEPKSFFEWRAKMYRTAAKALQAYRPEREPCEWCQGLSEKKFIRGNLIEPGEHTSIMANYCPNCGRKLEESE